MVIAGLAYALNEIIDSYQAGDDDSFGHKMKVTFTITGFIFGGPLLFHLVDRIPTLGKSDLSAASLRYTMISIFHDNMYLQGVSLKNLILQMAVAMKQCIFDPIIVKPKCV